MLSHILIKELQMERTVRHHDMSKEWLKFKALTASNGDEEACEKLLTPYVVRELQSETLNFGIGSVAQWHSIYLAFVRPWVQYPASKKKKKIKC
jgi:hypothetical protein